MLNCEQKWNKTKQKSMILESGDFQTGIFIIYFCDW